MNRTGILAQMRPQLQVFFIFEDLFKPKWIGLV